MAGRIDAARVAVVGHSMGGGGTLEAAKDRPSLKAAIPLTPWNVDKTWPEVTTPTLVIGAQNDTVAPVASHAKPFYQTLPSSTPRTYLELRGASHFAPNTSNTTIAENSIAWLKRFVDNDTRYTQFLCPTPVRAPRCRDAQPRAARSDRLTGHPAPSTRAARGALSAGRRGSAAGGGRRSPSHPR